MLRFLIFFFHLFSYDLPIFLFFLSFRFGSLFLFFFLSMRLEWIGDSVIIFHQGSTISFKNGCWNLNLFSICHRILTIRNLQKCGCENFWSNHKANLSVSPVNPNYSIVSQFEVFGQIYMRASIINIFMIVIESNLLYFFILFIITNQINSPTNIIFILVLELDFNGICFSISN